LARAKDNVEVELAAVVKAARTNIRLKHSIAADREINEVLPEIEKDFYAAVQRGKKYTPPVFAL
jgi:hypothetical protein